MKNIADFSGLSQIEADALLKKDGFNELNSQHQKSALSILLRVLSEPMILLLMAAGIIYLFMGELQDTLMLLFSVIAVISITLYQEIKTEKTLAALKDLSSPRALVIRDGSKKMIAGREVVTGDIVFINEGDRVPADAIILSSDNLVVDESLLTGESVSVRKADWDGVMEMSRPGGDDLPFVYSGSMITGGRGIVKVMSTGLNTEIGKIGKSLESIKEEDTLLHKETNKIVRKVATVALSLCLLVFLFLFLIKHDFVDGLLAGLTLAMAILPEEFPIVLTVFLTLGAWRISKNNVLTRRSSAIETLGAATVLCSDKTGTITLNKMVLSRLYANSKFCELSDTDKSDLSPEFQNLLESGVLASQKDLFDPMEKELNDKGVLYFGSSYNHDNLDLIKEYPITKELVALTHVWQSKTDQQFLVSAKGAPESIIELCNLDSALTDEILKAVKEMSDNGLRVLGVARANFSGSALPSKQRDFKFEFIGLLGFVDEIRPTVINAISEAHAAGIRVIMITGDYPGTAQFVAKKVGILNTDNYLTGADLERLSEVELREKIKVTNIFARVFPEQKLIIVNALKANNEIVAMTGDGVNDAPALKAAHIGVAMGGRGTDVAREAASLILLDDDFSSIVLAVRLGRRIYNNLKRSMGYLLSVHVPIAGMSVLPIFFGLPIIMFPAHVVFLELIIDPACSLVFEAKKEDDDIMERPPRPMTEPMFTRKTVLLNLAQGFSALLGILFIFILAIKTGRTEPEIRSFVFVSLVLANLMLIVTNLSWHKHLNRIVSSASRTMFTVVIGALVSLALVLYVPALADLFHMAPLYFKDLLLIVVVIIISLGWFEILKKVKKQI